MRTEKPFALLVFTVARPGWRMATRNNFESEHDALQYAEIYHTELFREHPEDFRVVKLTQNPHEALCA